jgi:hypothetical protein
MTLKRITSQRNIDKERIWGDKMKNKPVIHISGIYCPPELDQEFNIWYDQVHVPMTFKFMGMKRANRYKRVGDDTKYPDYLSIFEFDDLKVFKEYLESPELADALKEMESSCLSGGYERRWRVQYELIKNWERY